MPLFKVIAILLIAINGTAQISNTQLAEDLNYLKDQLEVYHPNLYVYSSPKEIDDYFQNLKSTASKSLKSDESYRLISSVSSIVKDGHLVFLPSQKILDDYYAKLDLLPFDIYWENDSAYVIRNYGNPNSLKTGHQILSINDRPIAEIQEAIYAGVLQDGHNQTYPRWILNNYARPYHAFFFGTSPTYKVMTLDEKGNEKVAHIEGMTYKAIGVARKENYPKHEANYNPEKAISLDIDEGTNIATLTIRSFENRELKKYKQNFHKEIKNAFKEILKNEVEALILDLRGNQGGQTINGKFLLRHLVKQPFQAVKGFSKVNKKEAKNPEQRNKRNNGFGTGYRQPFNDQYIGKLYTLINGGSFSCTGIVARVLKKHKRGQLIGEETAGSAYTLAGEPNKEITLPHSKIQVTIPTLQFILQDYIDKEMTGTFPDIEIKPTVEDMIKGKDVIMERVLEMIEKP